MKRTRWFVGFVPPAAAGFATPRVVPEDWPDFVDEAGESLPTDQALPIGVALQARMTILTDEMRSKIHRDRISVGTGFYCHEGSKRVTVRTVTQLTGLFAEKSPTQRSAGDVGGARR